MSAAPLQCEMDRDGCCRCPDEGRELFLVVEVDKTGYKDYHVYCEGCIEKNDWAQRTLMFRIGDDVTNHFL